MVKLTIRYGNDQVQCDVPESEMRELSPDELWMRWLLPMVQMLQLQLDK